MVLEDFQMCTKATRVDLKAIYHFIPLMTMSRVHRDESA